MLILDNENEKNSDEALAAASVRDPDLFNMLCRRYFESLRAFLFYKYVRNREAAEDLAQEALTRAFINRERFDPAKSWKTWIYAIAANCAKDFLRRWSQSHLELRQEILSAAACSPQEDFELQRQCQDLKDAMRQLAADQQKILHLVVWQEFSIAEAAAAMNLKLPRAKQLFRAARLNLLLFADRET